MSFLLLHVAAIDLRAKSILESNCILRIEKIFKKTLMGYRGNDDVPFLKFTLTSPKNVPTVRDKSPLLSRLFMPYANRSPFIRIFDQGQCHFQDLFDGPVATYESNIVFVLRFMIDTKVFGMNWIEVPAGKYKITPPEKKRSSCQLEITFRYTVRCYTFLPV